MVCELSLYRFIDKRALYCTVYSAQTLPRTSTRGTQTDATGQSSMYTCLWVGQQGDEIVALFQNR
jgi:hypothetical protein